MLLRHIFVAHPWEGDPGPAVKGDLSWGYWYIVPQVPMVMVSSWLPYVPSPCSLVAMFIFPNVLLGSQHFLIGDVRNLFGPSIQKIQETSTDILPVIRPPNCATGGRGTGD